MTHVELIEGDDADYGTYTTPYGDMIVRDVGLTSGIDPEHLDVTRLWSRFTMASASLGLTPARQLELFLAYLTALGVSNPVADVAFCPSCDEPYWNEDLAHSTVDGAVCGDCANLYSTCPCCEDTMRTSRLEGGCVTLGGERVCLRCIHRHYGFCDSCDGWFLYDDAAEHDHEDDEYAGDVDDVDDEDDEDDEYTGDVDDAYACCASPQKRFRLRNGDTLLASDTKVTIPLPARIGPDGISQIRSLLAEQYTTDGATRGYYSLAYYEMDELESQWQTSAGNYTRRLSKLAYDRHGLKIAPEIMTRIGTIARDHSKGGDLEIEFTRQLNRSARYFYHGESCWWGTSYGKSRCALKTNGGFGMRSFAENGFVNGRAWVMPLREESSLLMPTFDTENPGAFVVFNGYGELSSYVPCRALAHLVGWTYRKIEFECAPMFVNNAVGYLVAPEEITRVVTQISLWVDRHADLYAVEQRELSQAAA